MSQLLDDLRYMQIVGGPFEWDKLKDIIAEIERLTREIAEARTILAGTDIGSLPNDYPLSRMALDTWNILQQRTEEGLALIGKCDRLTRELAEAKERIQDLEQIIAELEDTYVTEPKEDIE